MDGRMGGRTDGRTYGRTDGRTIGRTDGRADRRTDDRTDKRTGGQSNGRTVGRTGGRADGNLSICEVCLVCLLCCATSHLYILHLCCTLLLSSHKEVSRAASDIVCKRSYCAFGVLLVSSCSWNVSSMYPVWSSLNVPFCRLLM